MELKAKIIVEWAQEIYHQNVDLDGVLETILWYIIMLDFKYQLPVKVLLILVFMPVG